MSRDTLDIEIIAGKKQSYTWREVHDGIMRAGGTAREASKVWDQLKKEGRAKMKKGSKYTKKKPIAGPKTYTRKGAEVRAHTRKAAPVVKQHSRGPATVKAHKRAGGTVRRLKGPVNTLIEAGKVIGGAILAVKGWPAVDKQIRKLISGETMKATNISNVAPLLAAAGLAILADKYKPARSFCLGAIATLGIQAAANIEPKIVAPIAGGLSNLYNRAPDLDRAAMYANPRALGQNAYYMRLPNYRNTI